MFWLYLLGVVTVLIIVLRRVLRRQKPLSDDLYAKKVAIDHVHSGVAWVPEDGKLGWLNPALPEALQREAKDLIGHDWYEIFAADDRERVRKAFSQMLLMGKVQLQTRGVRADGTFAWFEVLLVAIHDHKMRFVGHHCLIENRTREHVLEERLHGVSEVHRKSLVRISCKVGTDGVPGLPRVPAT
jgi:PAS domain S-box-containing protein